MGVRGYTLPLPVSAGVGDDDGVPVVVTFVSRFLTTSV